MKGEGECVRLVFSVCMCLGGWVGVGGGGVVNDRIDCCVCCCGEGTCEVTWCASSGLQ